MPLGTDDPSALLRAAGTTAAAVTASEIDISGTVMPDPGLLAEAVGSSVLLARSPTDANGTAILRGGTVVSPTTVGQVVVKNTVEAVWAARLGDWVATVGTSDWTAFQVENLLQSFFREHRGV